MENLISDYCKRGYFRWGKISRKCWQDSSRGGNFHETTPISFINAYGCYFRVGVIFAKKNTKARKRENYPHAKISTFTVADTFSIFLLQLPHKFEQNIYIFTVPVGNIGSLNTLVRAPPSKMREPYSNHFVCLSDCPSVCLSVRLSTLCCNAITKIRKTPIDFGVKRSKVKVIVTCPPSGALSDCVSFLVFTCFQYQTCS